MDKKWKTYTTKIVVEVTALTAEGAWHQVNRAAAELRRGLTVVEVMEPFEVTDGTEDMDEGDDPGDDDCGAFI